MRFSFLPKTLAGQFTLLLVSALLIANIIAILVLNTDQRQHLLSMRRGAQIDRLVTLVPALNSVEKPLRDQLLEALSNRRSKLSNDLEPKTDETINTTSQDDINSIKEAIHEILELPNKRPVFIAIEENSDWQPSRTGKHAKRAPNRRQFTRIDVSIPLADGTWLNSTQLPPYRPSKLPGFAILTLLGLSLLIVVAAGLWFIHRLTKPIKVLGQAAQRIGRGERDFLVPEAGPKEIQDVAKAFNKMQSDIARFDQERAHVVAAIGHDLRTPITSARIRAEMLDDEETSTALIRSLDQMTAIAQGLLTWGKNEANSEENCPVNIASLLQELSRDSQMNAQYTGVDALEIIGKPVALRRAFVNILENAQRYAGGCVVHIEKNLNEAIIKFSDEGPGIDENQLQTITQPFVRGEKSRSIETGGAGLGLSIVQSLIRAHGGTLTVQNRVDTTGLIVTIRLPIKK